MSEIEIEVTRALNTWFEETYKWPKEQALKADNWQDWEQIMLAFVDGYMACFWHEEVDDWWGF